ncbi:MAG: NAD(P)-dependent oxidoreductase, partial [Parachlamydia sp.]|nr:NAD(P)-dependent oxidoreductase [Parachlamydia sp.]
MKNKRVFISGGAGVIGTSLTDLLLREGADVWVGDLKSCPKEWMGKVKYRQGDLNTLSAQEINDFDPEIFFHLAATFERSEETYSFYAENFHHNVRLSHHLMDLLKIGPSLKTVVFASSYLIYDPQLYLGGHFHPLEEDSPTRPRNTCGGAKFFHELELQFLSHFLPQINFISGRIFRVYGRGSRDVISRFIRSAIRNETIQAYGTEGRFDFIFADDVAEALYRLALSNKNGIVNIGTGHARSIQDVLEVIKEHFPDLKVKESASDNPLENSQAVITRLEE